MNIQNRLTKLENASGITDDPHQMVEEMRELFKTLIESAYDEECCDEDYNLLWDRLERLRKEYDEKYGMHKRIRR